MNWEKILLRDMSNPWLRSAVVNLVLTVSVAVVTVLQAQLTDGHVNVSLIVGAAALAFSKWGHSALTHYKDVVDLEHWWSVLDTITPEPTETQEEEQ